MKASCILRPEREPIAILRKSFITICNGDRCAAMLLADFEYWHNVKLAGEEEEIRKARDQPGYVPNLSLWVYKSADDLTTDLLGEYGRNKVLGGVALLLTMGFLITRPDNRNNFSKGRWFLLQPDTVNAALISNGLLLNDRQFKKGPSTVYKGDSTGLKRDHIIRKEITSEITQSAEGAGAGQYGIGYGEGPPICPQCEGVGYTVRLRVVRGQGTQERVVCVCQRRR